MDEAFYAANLRRAQGATQFLNSKANYSFPLSAYLMPVGESLEQWQLAEKLILACLRTGDDKSAHLCIEHLVDRFGASNERVMGLRGIYQESVASSSQSLEKVLAEYDVVLTHTPTNIPIAKRRAALLSSMSNYGEASKALVAILELSPTDSEAWAELSDLYLSLGMFSQAIYCLEEVLLVVPNAWNIHARLGEALYMMAISDNSTSSSEVARALQESTKRFSRSIELCDGYLRGYCGLKMATDRLLQMTKGGKSTSEASDGSPKAIYEISERAAKAITAIIDASSVGHDLPELIVAKALVDNGMPAVSS